MSWDKNKFTLRMTNEIAQFELLSDEQIKISKEKITEELSKGNLEFEVKLTPISSKIFKNNDNICALLTIRLERTISNWLDSEGFVNAVAWNGKHLEVEIFDDIFSNLRVIKEAATVPLNVKDMAAKFEEKCNIKDL
jgi:hypothetical protein